MMSDSKGLVFGAAVDGAGKLVFDDRGKLLTVLRKLAGKRVEVVLRRPRSKRSLDQNAWWWGIAIPMIADEIGYDRHEYEQVHYALVRKCFGETYKPELETAVPNVRSSKLTTKEFAELMEWAVRFAAEHLHIALPLPNEVES